MTTVAELIRFLETLPQESEIKLRANFIMSKRNGKVVAQEGDLELPNALELKSVYYFDQYFECLL